MNRRATTKSYLAIFVCLATKAVNIEMVSELSSQAFIATLSHYTARRGHCQSISKLYQFIASRIHLKGITNLCSSQRIAFHFIPPHFGGIWEGAVKSTI
jgi:predicted ABC-type sugar transport system permease subunit